jgi:hypothetical protein
LKAISHDITTWIKIIQKYSMMTLDTNSTTEHMFSLNPFLIAITGVMPSSCQRKYASKTNDEVIACSRVIVT